MAIHGSPSGHYFQILDTYLAINLHILVQRGNKAPGVEQYNEERNIKQSTSSVLVPVAFLDIPVVYQAIESRFAGRCRFYVMLLILYYVANCLIWQIPVMLRL